MSQEYLLLKYGTIKDYNLNSEKSINLMKQYMDDGISYSVISQKDSLQQKRTLCELIDCIDGQIQNDWTGAIMTKEEAKNYIMEMEVGAI